MLQKYRFEEAICLEMEMPDYSQNKFLPPLSVQTLLENAFKHNIATIESPLCISITCKGDILEVKNNLQSQTRPVPGKQLGLINLVKRYELVWSQLPEFICTEHEYLVRLPLIEAE